MTHPYFVQLVKQLPFAVASRLDSWSIHLLCRQARYHPREHEGEKDQQLMHACAQAAPAAVCLEQQGLGSQRR